MALCPGIPGWAGTRKEVKPIRILLKQETVSGTGISWAICKSAPHSRQVTMPAPHRSVFYRPVALPATQPTVSKHWRHKHWRHRFAWKATFKAEVVKISKMQIRALPICVFIGFILQFCWWRRLGHVARQFLTLDKTLEHFLMHLRRVWVTPDKPFKLCPHLTVLLFAVTATEIKHQKQ